jgi:hypothetical protein
METGPEVRDAFTWWGQVIESDPGPWRWWRGSMRWTVEGAGGGTWLCHFGQRPHLEFDESAAIDDRGPRGRNDIACEVIASDESMRHILHGRLTPQEAYLSGKVRVRGAIRPALRCGVLFDKLLSRYRTQVRARAR